MPSELIVLAPHDSLEVLIHILTRHPRFDFHSTAVMLDCDGTISDLDSPSGGITLRGGIGSLKFFQWMALCNIPYFVVSARSTTPQTTLEVAQTVLGLQLPRPIDTERHLQEAFALRSAEQVVWYPDGPQGAPQIGLASGHVVSSIPYEGAQAALPKTNSVEFAMEHFLDSDPSLLCFVDDVFDNIADLYQEYVDDPDIHCLCVYFARPISLPDSELEHMTQLLATNVMRDPHDKHVLQRLIHEARAAKAYSTLVAPSPPPPQPSVFSSAPPTHQHAAWSTAHFAPPYF